MKKERQHSILTNSHLSAMALSSGSWEFRALMTDSLPDNLQEITCQIEEKYLEKKIPPQPLEFREPASVHQDAALRSPTVMVCGNEKITIRLLRQALEQTGFVVETVENGIQALSVYTHVRPEIVLLDASMPIMDGITTCAKSANYLGETGRHLLLSHTKRIFIPSSVPIVRAPPTLSQNRSTGRFYKTEFDICCGRAEYSTS